MFRGRGSALLDAIDRVRDAVLTFTANHATKHLPDSVIDPIAAGVPVDVGTANAAGAGNAFARHDHVHKHPDLAGGTLHAVASAVSAGFMSIAHFIFLDDFIVRPKIRYPVRNETGASLGKKTAVVAVGYHAPTDCWLVEKADYADPARRPATGILDADVPDASNGFALKVGRLKGVDTTQDDNGLPLGQSDQLVLGPAGKLIRPAPETTPFLGETQNIATVARVDAVDGELDVLVEGLMPKILIEQADAIPRPEGVVTGQASRAAATTYEGASYFLERDVIASHLLVKVSSVPTPGSLAVGVYQAADGGGAPAAAKIASAAAVSVAAAGVVAVAFDEGEVEISRGFIYILWGKTSGNFSMQAYGVAAIDLMTDAASVDGGTHPTSFTTTISTASVPASIVPRPPAAGGDLTPSSANVAIESRLKKV